MAVAVMSLLANRLVWIGADDAIWKVCGAEAMMARWPK